MPFLHRHSANQPLTGKRLHRILKTNHCTGRNRFEHVLAVDRTEQEYDVSRQTELTHLTIQHCTAALAQALSLRLR